jgi:DNA-binding SARP family transcriptional activator
VRSEEGGVTDGLDFRVLGSVRVLRGPDLVPIGGVKRRCLLALLIAGRNRTVSVASIADAVWEDDPPPSVASSIQVSVSGLRAALDTGAGPQLIETVAPGYRLTIPSGSCDIDRFAQARDAATQERSAGRLTAAAELYRTALSEWSGRAYEDLAGIRFADELAVELAEQRLATVESRVEVDLALGRHRELVPELGALLAEEPLRESLWVHQMVALYRCGRQADALAAGRRLRTILADELGLEPSAAVRDLEAAILGQDPRLNEPDLVPPQRQASLTVRDRVDIGPAQLIGADGSSVTVDGCGLKIGRLADNELVIDEPKVSRHHATIVATRFGYLVTDLHSTNGTLVNGERVLGDRLLRDGDEIDVGSAHFRFLAAASP